MKEQPKPCPFCGSEAVFFHNFNGAIYITCSACRANIYSWNDDAKAKRDILQRWNRRDYKESVSE